MAYTPYTKLSKRKQREKDARKRASWGQIKPVTRKIESAKAYSRKKTRRWHQDADGGFCFVGHTMRQNQNATVLPGVDVCDLY